MVIGRVRMGVTEKMGPKGENGVRERMGITFGNLKIVQRSAKKQKCAECRDPQRPRLEHLIFTINIDLSFFPIFVM